MIFKNGSAWIWSLIPEHILWLLLWQKRDDCCSNLRSVFLLWSESESLLRVPLGADEASQLLTTSSWDHHSPFFTKFLPMRRSDGADAQTSRFRPDRSRLKMWTSDLYKLKSEGFRVHAGAMDGSQPLISGLLLPISPKHNCSLVHKHTQQTRSIQ